VKYCVLFVYFYGILGFPGQVFSQACRGSLGDPVVYIDFGRGASFFAPPLGGNTNYTYVASGAPPDGSYTIEKGVTSGGASYFVSNHTANDPDGYLMMINASYQPGVFYETAVDTDLFRNRGINSPSLEL
jgi:hypothetical protein